jgi:hypothetical protein
MTILAGCSGDGSDQPEQAGNGGSTGEDDTAEDNSRDDESSENDESNDPEPASFEVIEYNLPERVALDEEVDFTITVQNTGGQSGSTTLPLYIRSPSEEWQEATEYSLEDVGAGETVSLNVYDGASFDYIYRVEFRLGESSETAVLQTVSAKISWGNEYTTPTGYRIRVDTPNLIETYEYEDYLGETQEKEAESGIWAFVNVWVKNETGQTEFSPIANDFGLLYGNSQSDGNTLLVDEPTNLGEPFDGGELQPNVERSGWIAYQVPDGTSVEDLTMGWSKETIDGQIAVNWSEQS